MFFEGKKSVVFWALWVGAGLGDRNGHLIGDPSSGPL